MVLILTLLLMFPASASNPDPCVAASSKTAYSDLLSLSSETRKKIEAYREKWRHVCSKSKEKISLSDLYNDIAEISNSVAQAFQNSEIALSEDKQVEELNKIYEKVYPSFIPAVEGSNVEYEYFRPQLETFVKWSAILGSTDDKMFWQGYKKLWGQFTIPPWQKQTWDFGGCTSFGAYDWISELRLYEGVQKAATNKVYRKLLEPFKVSLFGQFAVKDPSGDPVTQCICGSQASMTNDVRVILQFLAKQGMSSDPFFGQFLTDVKKFQTALNAGKVAIKTVERDHCDQPEGD